MIRSIVPLLGLAMLSGCGESETAARKALVARGEHLFERCATCHTLGPEPFVGPGLEKVYGREAASGIDFPYSEALAVSGIIWDEAQLIAFLTQGEAYLPGINMVLTPMSEDDARALAAFLRAATGPVETSGGAG